MAKDEKIAETTKPKAKKKPKLLIMIIAVVVLGVAGGGFFLWKSMSAKPSNAHAAPPPKESHGGGGSEGGEGSKAGATITLEPFLVNLADKESSRYLKTSIRILVSDAETAKTVSGSDILMPRMRDTILSILSTKMANDIINNDGKQKLKKEIIDKVNEFIPGKSATDVFFTDFVVQL